MKKTLLTLALAALATVSSYAQGSITFVNNALTRHQWEATAGAALSQVALGAPIVYGVLWGTTADNLSLNDGALGTASTTSLGLIAAANPYIINGGAEGATVFMRIAGWSSSFQRDWATASQTAGAHYGQSAVREVRLGPTSGPGTVIWSGSDTTKFQPLQIRIVPEPSVIALGVLGVGALLLRRRKTA